MEKINIKELEKFDLRVGKVKDVQDHPNADKLYILLVDLGEDNVQIIAGIKKWYKKEELIGKNICIIKNLEPVTLRGIESNGMLLAAEFKDKVVLISPEKNIEVGARIH